MNASLRLKGRREEWRERQKREARKNGRERMERESLNASSWPQDGPPGLGLLVVPIRHVRNNTAYAGILRRYPNTYTLQCMH